MEHAHNFRQDESIQFSYFGRPTIGKQNLVGSLRPWAVDLINQNSQTLARRKHARFKIKRIAFCLIRSNPINLTNIEYMSMGKIAMAALRSRPNKMGRIKDIGMEGLSFRYVDPQDWPNEPYASGRTDQSLELDILMADCRFYLSNLPFKTIFDVDINDELSLNTIKMKQLGIKFGALTQHQKTQLKNLIETYSIKKF